MRCSIAGANLLAAMTKALLPYLFILPSLAYSLLTLHAVCAFFRRAQKREKSDLPVSVIKPVKGLDTNSRQNLESFCLQNHPEFQIIFALRSPEDPCLPLLRQLAADYPGLDLEIVIDPTVHGSNAKVCNLINAFPFARHDIIVMADSDIKVEAGYLSKISAYFSDAHVGMVTSLYRGGDVQGAASALEALGFTVEMIPNVIVAEMLEGLSFGLGASMAVRRNALEEIGGFRALADYLADDYQLGNMIHRAGWKVELSGDFVESVMQRESLADTLSRQVRWCRTMRVSRPWGYFASGITHPVPAIAASFLIAGFTAHAFVAATLLYLLRVGVVTFTCRSFIKDGLLPRYLWLLPFRDLLSTATWALAFTGNRVNWRGEFYTLQTGGKMLRND